MDLSAVAAELYALLPSEFTAARGAKAKEAKSGGDPELARRIGRLPKPSTSAWAVNMLARHAGNEIDGVLELGASLRRAQEEHDSSGLRELGQQRSKVLSAAVRQARSVADGFGIKVSDAAADEIEDTLRAAMADAGAALAVQSGQLVKPLSSNGLDPVELGSAVAVPEALPQGVHAGLEAAADVETEPGVPVHKPEKMGQRLKPAATKAAPSKQQREQEKEDRKRAEQEARQRRERDEAQEAAEEAERNAKEAEADLAEAESQVADTASRRDKLAAEIAELKDKLAKLEDDLEAVERLAKFAERSRTMAARLVRQERQAAERARERLTKLD